MASEDHALDAHAHDLTVAIREDATRHGTPPPDALARQLYDELRRIASAHRAGWTGDDTLNTTAIVHEAYLKLARTDGDSYKNTGHFLSVASRAMRQVLVSYARRRTASKRGGSSRPLPLDDAPEAALLTDDEATDVIGLDGALGRLGAFDDRAARVVELRVFGDLTLDETAAALGVSEATVTRDWRRARAWLRSELGELNTLAA